MNDIYLLNAKRTAIGKFLGSLYENDPCNVSSDGHYMGVRKKYFQDDFHSSYAIRH